MSTETAAPSITADQSARRERIVQLTDRGNELYSALKTNAAARDKEILAELESGTTPNELAKLTGLTVARIYKLRDNAKNRAKE